MSHNAIAQDSVPPGAPINDKRAVTTPGYAVGLNHHNALTFSQCAALGHRILVPATTTSMWRMR